jgi:hypothetical protein
MKRCHLLTVDDDEAIQSHLDDSFIGGQPKLPEDEEIPLCLLCGAKQSFFFQVAMPKGELWGGLSVAVFACTSCEDRNHMIPQLLPGPLHNVAIPSGFLEKYQINFRILVFDTAKSAVVEQYDERVKFKRLHLIPSESIDVDSNKIGGAPNWILDDETPGNYGGAVRMFFLLQLLENFKFEVLQHAPRQVVIGLDGVQRCSNNLHYELFVGNKLFFFGTESRDIVQVYVLPQSD